MLADGFEKEKAGCGVLVAVEVKWYMVDESFAFFSGKVSLLESGRLAISSVCYSQSWCCTFRLLRLFRLTLIIDPLGCCVAPGRVSREALES